LLKGFASRLDGQEAFTWVYRRGGRVFEANIKNVAVEKHFYTGKGENDVDDEITELEKLLVYHESLLERRPSQYA
jgi:hypothetical protein